jgi:acyl-[acyl-carrier-protein]-phospholipid O-acyltransferase/long-chain-fatty-acid--[acyl-carrier-protein] ligase
MTRVIERMASNRDLSPPDDLRPSLRPAIDFDALPTLYRDRSFWGMTVTQFMGAFNDSVFKQVVLLLTAQVLVISGDVVAPQDMQPIPLALFALSFILLSGVAGYWADRTSKRTIIMGCKFAEVAIMIGGVVGLGLMAQPLFVHLSFDRDATLRFEGDARELLNNSAMSSQFSLGAAQGELQQIEALRQGDTLTLPGQSGGTAQRVAWGGVTIDRATEGKQPGFELTREMPWLLIIVLTLMGVHSAIFGPAKYGILPEMVRARDLPRFNGIIQMTTFLALIGGTVLAGFLMDVFGNRLWVPGMVCVAIAVIGTATSFLVRRTPVAEPDAEFGLHSLGVSIETRELLRDDRPLRRALVVYSLFWFVAAVIPPAVNALGRNVLSLSATKTSLMLGCISFGIAGGCLLAGKLSASRVRFGLVRVGTWGMLICMLLISCPGISSQTLTGLGVSPEWLERLPGVDGQHLLGFNGSAIVLAIAGLFAGLLAVPLQVYLQAKPPETLKGRLIGTMNLINWVGIIFSTVFYGICQRLCAWLGLPTFFTFGATALLILLPIALFYRPADVSLE